MNVPPTASSSAIFSAVSRSARTMYTSPARARTVTDWSVTFVDGPGTTVVACSATPSSVCPTSGFSGIVTIRSTVWPGTSVPPTAFAATTVRLTARQSGPLGSNSSPRSRIENAWPSVVEARTLRVTSCPVATGMPATRPSTSSSRVKAVSFV